MGTTLFADVTPLLDALAASDESRVISETLDLLATQNVTPAKLAGRVGLAALWGGADGRAVGALAATGRIAEWMRGIPIGVERASEEWRRLAPALPLVQGMLAVSRWVGAGVHPRTDTLPEPLMPSEIQHPGGPLGVLREALARRDVTAGERVLLGYHATGADYRSLLATVYGALDYRYPDGGRPLTGAYAGARILDMADWGGAIPAFVSWYTPLMMDQSPDQPLVQASAAYGSAPEHDLSWLRTRIAIAKEEAAGANFQRALVAGDATAACEATLGALKAGASPRGVAAGMTLAAASGVNAVAEGDRARLLAAGQVLLYTHAVHVAMTQAQDPHIWPLLYTAACAVNAPGAVGTPALEGAASRATVSVAAGGNLPATMLRSVEERLGQGDTATSLATAQRYVQTGNPARALAGVMGTVAAQRDTSDAEALLVMPFVAAAAENYQLLPSVLANGGQNALLTAAIRLAGELRGSSDVAERVRAAIESRVARVQ
jgi:hypothetical protein